ncbi:MAG TPA: hypothetical protein PKY99_08250, partial [Turneriella sp.]|nr:hypothetical protein [Turneriella sp.]
REMWEFALKGNATASLPKIQSLLDSDESVSVISGNDIETRFAAETTSGFNERLFALAVSEKWTLREMFMQKQSIEDVFARLTAKATDGQGQ